MSEVTLRLFMAVSMTIAAAVADFGGVVDTGEQFIAGVNDRPEIIRRCQRHRRIESPANISLPNDT
jgi:hypothetical protein